MRRTSVVVDPELEAVLKALGGPKRALGGLGAALKALSRSVDFAFGFLTRELSELLERPLPPPRRPPLLAGSVGGWAGPEPYSLEDLAEDLMFFLPVALGLRPAFAVFRAPRLLAVWGTAQGEALGLSALPAAALGEFCRAWVSGMSSRFGNLDRLLELLLGAFSEALSGHPEVSTLPGGGARLFPDPAHRAEEAPFYRLGWEAVLFALSALDRGELPEEEAAAVRFALAGGRRAAGG